MATSTLQEYAKKMITREICAAECDLAAALKATDEVIGPGSGASGSGEYTPSIIAELRKAYVRIEELIVALEGSKPAKVRVG